MEIEPTKLKGCYLIKNTIHSDNRGHFTELFRSSNFNNLTEQLFQPVQTNLSLSHMGAVRGIHFSSAQNGQKKFVSCVNGRINDSMTYAGNEKTLNELLLDKRVKFIKGDIY